MIDTQQAARIRAEKHETEAMQEYLERYSVFRRILQDGRYRGEYETDDREAAILFVGYEENAERRKRGNIMRNQAVEQC